MVTITTTLNQLDSMAGNNIDSDGQECVLREDYKDLPFSVKRRPPAVGMFYKTGLYQNPKTGLCQWCGCAYGVWRWYGNQITLVLMSLILR